MKQIIFFSPCWWYAWNALAIGLPVLWFLVYKKYNENNKQNKTTNEHTGATNETSPIKSRNKFIINPVLIMALPFLWGGALTPFLYRFYQYGLKPNQASDSSITLFGIIIAVLTLVLTFLGLLAFNFIKDKQQEIDAKVSSAEERLKQKIAAAKNKLEDLKIDDRVGWIYILISQMINHLKENKNDPENSLTIKELNFIQTIVVSGEIAIKVRTATALFKPNPFSAEHLSNLINQAIQRSTEKKELTSFFNKYLHDFFQEFMKEIENYIEKDRVNEIYPEGVKPPTLEDLNTLIENIDRFCAIIKPSQRTEQSID